MWVIELILIALAIGLYGLSDSYSGFVDFLLTSALAIAVVFVGSALVKGTYDFFKSKK